jgi:hypothetical protein
LPELGEEGFDLVVYGGVDLIRIGFLCRQRYGLILPAKGF